MSANSKSSERSSERGNAMIYVIIIIALFGALTFIMARQSDTGESGAVSSEKTNINATHVLQASAQVQQAVEQMTYTGLNFSSLNFILPSDTDFNTDDPGLSTDNNQFKVFHPDGGGVTLPKLPPDAVTVGDTTTPPGFYLGRFNNVQWSALDSVGNPIEDVVLLAYQVSKPLCESLNFKLTGSTTIPVLTKPLKEVFIDDAHPQHGGGSNTDFETANCVTCEGVPSLCVKDSLAEMYGFYTLILAKNPPQ